MQYSKTLAIRFVKKKLFPLVCLLLFLSFFEIQLHLFSFPFPSPTLFQRYFFRFFENFKQWILVITPSQTPAWSTLPSPTLVSSLSFNQAQCVLPTYSWGRGHPLERGRSRTGRLSMLVSMLPFKWATSMPFYFNLSIMLCLGKHVPKKAILICHKWYFLWF